VTKLFLVYLVPFVVQINNHEGHNFMNAEKRSGEKFFLPRRWHFLWHAVCHLRERG
jgi:hypothetical protein